MVSVLGAFHQSGNVSVSFNSESCYLTCTLGQDTTKKISGRFYRALSHKPVTKAVYTQCNANGRAPRTDLIFSEGNIQPYVHDGVFSVVHRGKTSRFHVFVKNHKALSKNRIVQRWTLGVLWKGDILVMRKGVAHEVVNMRGKDANLIDYAIKR